ncbi:alpha/beta hydrolase [Bacillus sp. 2205SS5-2]|uniref:alpha/beta hydrolase n=1 Tax=Bacillus sp. 2205SS5-2 TaxID=3109031 RepID=UPI00300745F1
MKKWKAITSGALTAALLTAFGVYSTNRLLHIQKKDEEEIIRRERVAKRLNQEEFDALPKEEMTIPSAQNYPIHAYFVQPHDTKKYVVFCHGVTETKWNSIKYMNLFLKRGYNAVIYDHRRHGLSGGDTTSYGHFEKQDLKAIVDEVRHRVGEDAFIGIHGESMGAATLLLYAGSVEDGADFYIADCPYSDFQEQFLYRVKVDTKLNMKWLAPVTDLFLKHRGGFTFKHIAPLAVVDKIYNPVLFIHSKDDDFILPSMTKALFEKKQGEKMLYISEKGAHAQSYNENPTEYEEVIEEFLCTYVHEKEFS